MSEKGHTVVDGTFGSSEAVWFKTPSYEEHGALSCDVHVSIGSGNWTVNHIKFQVGSALQRGQLPGCRGNVCRQQPQRC